MKGPTGIVSIRLRMNFISLSPIYKFYQNSSEQAVLSDRCSTLNPAFSKMASTNKMIMNENRDSKYLGYYIIYALNISHSALQSAVYSSVLSFDYRAILASTVNIAHICLSLGLDPHTHTNTDHGQVETSVNRGRDHLHQSCIQHWGWYWRVGTPAVCKLLHILLLQAICVCVM